MDWAREAERLTIYLDQELLLAAARYVIPGATGELLWVYPEGQAEFITLYVHPVLLVHGASESLQLDRVGIVPHFHAGDPLLCRMTLVLQAAIEAEGVPEVLSHISILSAKSGNRVSVIQWLTDSQTLEKANVRQNRTSSATEGGNATSSRRYQR
jgi:hypothetical protein